MGDLHLGILFILALAIFGGMIGALVFQRFKIPQVVGYIAIGLILGESCLGLVSAEDVASLKSMNLFALGIIGFLVGGELKIAAFKKYARQFSAIMLGEGLGAFLLVGSIVTLVLYLFCKEWSHALAGGAIFGAIAAATDPASTIDVLWEYRAKGIMTTSLIAVVALDDALAMTLYGLGSSVAEMLTTEGGSITSHLVKISVELAGAILVGVVFAYALSGIFRLIRQPEKNLAVALGVILFVIALSVRFNMDVILACMALGFTLTNVSPRRSEEIFKLMRNFSVPIYVLFFVLVGARLNLGKMPGWLWSIVFVYVIGRSIGKISGAFLGARWTGSDRAVRRYLGMGLLCQGGVAVGLSIMASEHVGNFKIFGDSSLGDVVVFAITATTLLNQVIGPAMVKLAIKFSDEKDRNVTEEDAVEALNLKDVINTGVRTIKNNMPLKQVVSIISRESDSLFPVVDGNNDLVGTLTMESLKEVMVDSTAWDWLLAADIMSTSFDTMDDDLRFSEIFTHINELKLAHLVIVRKDARKKLVGTVDTQKMHKCVHSKLLSMQFPEALQA